MFLTFDPMRILHSPIKGSLRKGIGLMLLACLSSELFAQDKRFLDVDTTKYIAWNEGRPLTWDDYKLLEDSSEGDSYALTAVTHSIRGGIEGGKPNFQVYVLFKIKDSWTSNRSDTALFLHERLHFDIAELYGRKLRKQIATMGENGETNLSVYKRKIKLLLREFNRKSLDYDEETRHGTDSEKQKEWVEFVNHELLRLNEYM